MVPVCNIDAGGRKLNLDPADDQSWLENQPATCSTKCSEETSPHHPTRKKPHLENLCWAAADNGGVHGIHDIGAQRPDR